MFKLFRSFRLRDVLLILLAIVLICAQVWLDLKIPDFMSEITRLVQTPGSEIAEILKNGALMLACAFGSLISAVIVGYLAANISASFSKVIRKKVFKKVESLSMAEVKKFSVGSLITRTTNDITQVEMLVSMGMQMMIKAPITAVWAITKIVNKSWEWSTATAVTVVILLSIVAVLMVLVVPRFKIIQRLTDKLNSLTRENITGIRVVRAFNAESYQQRKFENRNDELTRVQIFSQRALSILSPTIFFFMHSLTLAIYVIGTFLIDHAEGPAKLTLFSNMIVFSSYAMQVVMSFLMLAVIFMMVPRAQVSAARINEVLNTEQSIKEGTIEVGKTNQPGTVEFKNVSFKYPDAKEYILENISFKATKGQTVAFIGSTGSGKSTLINLIPRFYDTTAGEVLIDGVNVKDYTFKSLYNKLGYVPQKAVMFDDTVTANVAFGDNGKGKKTAKQITDAIKIAQGTNFVEKLDKTYFAHIAQGGTNISGGQKQRLAIARAIARDPEIYIFDDSFSALDYKTDATLRKALKAYTKDATSLIVAQRIGTIMSADQIIVLDSGKCVGKGTHQELLKSCKVYQEIAKSQLSEDELMKGAA
ncbi:ABC transporter ATP-binding protein [Candidatus Saccharibacteria bacterium]|nr:ABC transporter ATP-binding protein [Candidatus Saccharibacteria bacterium]MBR2989811.1 ABC transporter ATP-binding protein [Candidatus Saccharibacteria bacterium]